MKEEKGIIERPIGRSNKDFRLKSAQRGARGKIREAITEYEVLKKTKLTDKQVDDVVKGLHRTNDAKDKFFESAMAGLRAEYDKYEKRKSKLLDRRVDEEICVER